MISPCVSKRVNHLLRTFTSRIQHRHLSCNQEPGFLNIGPPFCLSQGHKVDCSNFSWGDIYFSYSDISVIFQRFQNPGHSNLGKFHLLIRTVYMHVLQFQRPRGESVLQAARRCAGASYIRNYLKLASLKFCIFFWSEIYNFRMWSSNQTEEEIMWRRRGLGASFLICRVKIVI